MNDVLKIFLSLSFSGSLMILILFVCKHFWKEKISRQWQYYIWLIVLARFLFPFAPETNLMGSIFQTVDHTILQMDTIPSQQYEQNNLQDIENIPAFSTEQDEQEESKLWIQDITTLLANNIWLIWLGIALILLIRKITVYQSFVRYVKAGQIFVSDIALLDRLSVLTEKAGVKKPIELCVNPLISSPLLIGFLHPCIVLPDLDISEKDFQYTVLHELTHFKRRDMFYKWLVQITVCLHWFNPLVYVMSREINKACELSCDEAIITKLDEQGAQEYGHTLLDAIAKAGNYKESVASITLNENKKILKERLGAIMNFKKKSRITAFFTFLLTVAFICGASYTGAYAAERSSANSTNKKQNKQDTKDYSQIINKPGTKFRMINMWSGSSGEVTRQDGITEVNMTNFIGSRINYEFEADHNGTAVLRLNSSLSGDYEILFMEEGNSTILETIPSFTGNKKVILTELPKNTIYLTIYAMNTSGKLEIEKVSTTDSSDTLTSKTPQEEIDGTDQPYTYSQSGFYQGSYIFELGWNLNEKSYDAYPDKAELTLSDLTTITVSFDKSYKKDAQNQAVLADLKELIERLKTDSIPPLEYPLVVSITSIGDNELVALAEEYYTNGKLTRFSAIFSSLDSDIQKEYCNRMLKDNKLAFFSSCAGNMDTDMLEYCTEKAYQKKRLTFFSSIAPYLTDSQRQTWVARASKDDRITFLSVLTEKKKAWEE